MLPNITGISSGVRRR